jgi:hypothetical protein
VTPDEAGVARWRHLVFVVASGVEVLGLVLGPVTNGLLPGVVPLLLVVSLLLVPLPAVLPVLGLVLEPMVLEGLVVLLEEVEAGVASRLLQAPSERAAATVSVATAIRAREVFIGKLLEVVRIREGHFVALPRTLGNGTAPIVGTGRWSL